MGECAAYVCGVWFGIMAAMFAGWGGSYQQFPYIMSELNIKTELTPFPGMRKGHNLFIYSHILFYFKVINENLQNFEYFTEF